MKIFVGILSVLILLAAGTLAVLAVWEIYPVSWTLIWKSGVSLLLASVVLSLLWQLVVVFFKKEKHKADGNKAHRMH
ncbi:MAG: hypothetical protein LBV74_18120 [Tannerella sp.]|jgi:type VI protein secretion system component VasK|nr:hypothetical protein [Tannerella sp.]